MTEATSGRTGRTRQAVRKHGPATASDIAIAAVAAANPWLGVGMAAAKPVLASGIDRIIDIAGRRRRDGGEAVLIRAVVGDDEGAIDIADLEDRITQFTERIESDPKVAQLAIRAVEAGQAAYADSHIAALADALRSGVRAQDDVALDRELLVVSALSELEPVHALLLAALISVEIVEETKGFFRPRVVARRRVRRGHCSDAKLIEIAKGIAPTGWQKVISTLERTGTLVREYKISLYGTGDLNSSSVVHVTTTTNMSWRVSEFGYTLLARLGRDYPPEEGTLIAP